MGKNVIISTLPNISQNYLPKVNTSNIFANSLVYDDGSSVLINTTTASAFRLDVNGTGRFQGALTGTSATFSSSVTAGSSSATNYGTLQIMGGSTSASLTVGTAANTVLAFSPGQELAITGNSTAPYGITFQGRNSLAGGGASGTSYPIIFNPLGGNVGIGTTSPDVTGFGYTTLTIKGGTTAGYAGVLELQTTQTTTNGQNVGIIAFLDGTSRNAQIGVQRDTSTSTSNMMFYTNAGSGIVERMRISSVGTVIVKGQNDDIVQVGDSIAGHNAYLQLKAGSSGNAYVNSTGSGSLIFGANGAASTHMRITSGGNVLINTTSNNGLRLGEKLNVSTLNDYGGIAITTYAGSSAGRSSIIDLNKSRGTSDGSMTAVANGDEIGYLIFRGSDGTNFVDGAYIRAEVEGTVSANSVPMLLKFHTGPSGTTERMRITSGGYLKASDNGSYYNSTQTYHEFNQSANNDCLIARSTNASFAYTNFVSVVSRASSTVFSHFYAVHGGGTACYIRGDGNIYNTNGVYSSTSDIKLKENIIDATPKLADLLKVKVRNYNLIGNTEKHIGVIAQELEEVFPNLVEDNFDRDSEGKILETTTKSVKYSVFVPMLIKAIQEQQAQIEEQKADIESLKALINK